MKPQLQIVGVYPIPQAEEPCHLIEIVLKGAIENFYMGDFTQEQKDDYPPPNYKVIHHFTDWENH
jgi:hypothetical protein